MAKNEGTGLLELCAKLEVPLDLELRELLPVVRALHDHRRGSDKPVSRTSLLYAATQVQPAAAQALAEGGLDLAAWESKLGVEGFDADEHRPPPPEGEPPPPEDLFAVDPGTIGPSLEAYLAGFAGFNVAGDVLSPRPLDSLGLAFGIVAATISGEARSLSQEISAGLEPSRAASALAERIRFRNHAPRGALDEFELSWVAAEALRQADVRIEEHYRPFVPMTATLLFIGFDLAGQNEPEPNASWFVHDLFARRSSENPEFESRVDDWVTWYYDRTPRWLAGENPDGPPPVTRAVVEAFDRARRIAISVRGARTVHGRDLLGALLGEAADRPDRRSGMGDLLEHLGFGLDEVIAAFLDYLEEHAPPTGGDDLAAWRLVFQAEDSGVLGLPRFDAEGFEGPDLLGVTRDVNAFANLLAAESLVPPLAVGLFGDWGSGKSFFMQKLRRRIDALAAAARRRGRGETSFLGNVVQIEFNAWHYVDTNLWASLVTHIFERLHRHFVPQEDEERKRWEQLLEKLDQAFDLRSDAEETLAAAHRELAAAEELRRKERVGLGRAVQAVWAAMKSEPALKEDLARAEKLLGVGAMGEVRDELLLRRREAGELAARLPLFRQTVVHGLGSLRSLGPAAVVALAGVLLAVLLPRLPGAGEALEAAAARIAEVVALVGGAGTWLGTAFRRASRAMSTVERIEANLQEKLDADSPAVAALRRAEQRVAAADEAVAARRRRIAELRQQVESLRPAQRLSNFLAERASSTDYRQHLGLAAMIRRDFERLHALMRPQGFDLPLDGNVAALEAGAIPDDLRREVRRYDVPFARERETEGDSPGEAATTDAAGADGAATGDPAPRVETVVPGQRWRVLDPANGRTIEIERGGSGAGGRRDAAVVERLRCTLSWNLPRIDRIILYIDDLDRCPPERVVEVLQAVHLLLAFPLFVVVVGVDARWVSRSLALRFKSLWRREEGQVNGSAGAGDPNESAATPQDYLEKIFQVPFWLEPMSEGATRDYIDGLVAASIAGSGGSGGGEGGDREERRADGAGGEGSDGSSGGGTGEDGADAGLDTAAARGSDAGNDEAGSEATGEGDDAHDKADGWAGEDASGAGGEGTAARSAAAAAGTDLGDAELKPASLELKQEEHRFMRWLAPLIGRSPRAVKRYVNVYRLIRAGISEDARLLSFLGTPEAPGPYRAVLLLLGVVVGVPALADAFFRELREGKQDRSVEDLLSGVHTRVDGTPAAADYERLAALLRRAPREVRNGLRVQDMADYRRQVGRYSFRVGRI